jgi:hypothetical protein
LPASRDNGWPPMNQFSILFPVMALVGWTLAVLILIPDQRFKAGFSGRVTADDFRFGESANVPPEVSIPNRNYMNLLELPVVFYIICVIQYITQMADQQALVLAWTYVVLRVLHSLVHLTYNKVRHRLLLFAASNVVLMLAWIHLLLKLGRSSW